MVLGATSDLRDLAFLTVVRTATLFGLTSRTEVSIQLLACPSCNHRRRWIGPDLGSAGVLNWNNTHLFTHELLNAYTNQFTASETPFSAFCRTMRRQYMDQMDSSSGAHAQFCADETFVRAWFAFAQLQDLGNTMSCPTCGPNPHVVIADGISLATQSSKLTHMVKPPTHTDSTSERLESISSYRARGLPAITKKEVRTAVNKFIDLTGPSTTEAMPMDQLETQLSRIEEKHSEVAQFLRLILQAPSVEHKKVYREFARQVSIKNYNATHFIQGNYYCLGGCP